VLVFTLLITAVTALLFGLLPAWQSSRVALVTTLREAAGAVGGGPAHVRLRKGFVALQVALSAMLLLGAGLFVRTLINLSRVDLGVQSENVVSFRVSPVTEYDAARKLHLYRSLAEGLAGVPGVRAVGLNRNALFTGGRWDSTLTIPGVSVSQGEPFSFFNAVTPGYFEALGIPVRAGRDFTWRDWGSGKKLALVNEALVAEYFERKPPLGRMLGRGTRSAADIEIIGVFGNTRYHEVRGSIPNQTFVNLDSVIDRISRVTVYARVDGDPRRQMAALRAQVSRIDPQLTISEMRTLDDQIHFAVSNERLLAFLSAGFALLATLLALIGLYGVLAFVVTRRTREIGIRMALGAERRSVIRLVANEMALVVLCGLASGIAAAYASGRFIEAHLFGVEAADPLVFCAVPAMLLTAAAVATILPALRASRIDPMNALRHE
jgi:predicted permease